MIFRYSIEPHRIASRGEYPPIAKPVGMSCRSFVLFDSVIRLRHAQNHAFVEKVGKTKTTVDE
jgi:hypothetical protein